MLREAWGQEQSLRQQDGIITSQSIYRCNVRDFNLVNLLDSLCVRNKASSKRFQYVFSL